MGLLVLSLEVSVDLPCLFTGGLTRTHLPQRVLEMSAAYPGRLEGLLQGRETCLATQGGQVGPSVALGPLGELVQIDHVAVTITVTITIRG